MNEQGKHVLDRLRATIANGEAPKASDEEFSALVKYACQLEDKQSAADSSADLVGGLVAAAKQADAVLQAVGAEYVEPKK